MFAGGNPVGKNGIDRIRKSHGDPGLDIPAYLYPYWKQAFLQAVSEFDAEFSEDLRGRWDKVLQKTIDHVCGAHEA
jgi:hypothetical protein